MLRSNLGAHRLVSPAPPRRTTTRARHALFSISMTLLVSGLVVVLTTVARPPAANAAQAAVGLGTATSYAVLAGQAVSNTGPSVVSGDLGVSPGTAVTGFPPGLVEAGTIHSADATALKAQDDLTTAYNDAAGRGPAVDQTDKNLGGQTLVAGVYRAAEGLDLTGTVTLDAQGDPAAVFVFQAGSTLITASDSAVALTNGAQACNVFWQVGSSATIGTTTSFVGTVMALTSITAKTGATVQGRLLARNGSVTLDSNTITRSSCAAAPPTETPTEDPTETPTETPTAAPTDAPSAAPPVVPVVPPAAPTGTPTGTPTSPAVPSTPVGDTSPPKNPSGPGAPPESSTPATPRRPSGPPPWVPEGNPPTGYVAAQHVASPTTGTADGLWIGLALIALGGLAGLAGKGRRPLRRH